jgi:hypothetical protein
MASSSTGTLSEEGPWGRLPEELMLKVLDREWTPRDSGAVRGTCRRWRAMHDADCKTLVVRNGVMDEVFHALCGRLPALTSLDLSRLFQPNNEQPQSLTAEGLRAVGSLTALSFIDLCCCTNLTDAVLRELHGLTALTHVNIGACDKVTHVGLRELGGLTALTWLNICDCPNVTDAGLRELHGLTALTTLYLKTSPTTKAGRDALKAAIPGLLTIDNQRV